MKIITLLLLSALALRADAATIAGMGGGTAPITIDSAVDGGTDQLSWAHTVTNADLLVVMCAYAGSGVSGAVAFNNQSFTKLRADTNAGSGGTTWSDIWYLNMPLALAGTIIVTNGTAVALHCGSISLRGTAGIADVSAPVDAQGGGTTNASATTAKSVTTVGNNSFVIDVTSTSASATPTNSGADVVLFSSTSFAASYITNVTPAATKTITWTSTAGSYWTQSIMSVGSYKVGTLQGVSTIQF